MGNKIAIVGAGLSGIASAIRLAKEGYKVVVYEKNKTAGGKIEELRVNGYRFDTGASILTLPELIEELYQLAGEKISDFITFKKLTINSRFYYADGTILDAYHDNEEFASTIEQVTGEDKRKIVKFLTRNQKLYDLTKGIFIFSPFHNIKSISFSQALKVMFNIFRLKIFTSMHSLNKKWFKDKRVVQLFDRYATYNGSNPYQAPATLSVISHLEHNVGSFLPEKGMYQLITGLVQLAEKLGVEFKYENQIEEIITNGKRVKGLKVNGDIFNFNIIINNTDVFYTYKNLLNHSPHSHRIFRQELSCSCIIFYLGMNRISKDLRVHNILFSENYKEEFEYIFRKKSLYHDPSIYIYVSSKICHSDAPDGCENWLVMINAPNDGQQNWEEQIPEARTNVVSKIKSLLNTDIEKHIQFEKHSSPASIEKWTSSYKGALYGASTSSIFSTFTRHANFKRSIKGLYFAGGTVHPGGGIPLCLASAQIVSELVKEDFPNN